MWGISGLSAPADKGYIFFAKECPVAVPLTAFNPVPPLSLLEDISKLIVVEHEEPEMNIFKPQQALANALKVLN